MFLLSYFLSLLWFNVTFSDISAIKCQDSCPVSKFRLPGTNRYGQLGALSFAKPTPTRAPVRSRTSLTSLRSEGPRMVRVCRESNPDLSICSPARYHCATVVSIVLFAKTLLKMDQA